MRAGFALLFCSVLILPVRAADVLVEAESFRDLGGWSLDTQFIPAMGSPYLLAHGLGRPVKDATTVVEFPASGRYHVFVRTKDWVARWKAPGQPGKFQLVVNDKPLETVFGTQGGDWGWQDGGAIDVKDRSVTIALHDLTGFEGRCDAICFTTDSASPPSDAKALAAWRCKMLGIPETPPVKKGFDLVVIGGGYSGMGAAISAARMGCKVALLQDRSVLGGNGSSEVRVWAQGKIRRGKYPRIGEIVEEFADRATKSPGTTEEFEDAKKEAIVRAESNISLFFNQYVDEVETRDGTIRTVVALDTHTGQRTRYEGRLFADCTGHAAVGFLAGADWDMPDKGRMGMSNMWAWGEGKEEVKFPEVPWALDLTMKDFPYPNDHHGPWFWESGFDKDPIGDAEGIRDWNLRAVYGAFNAMKNKDGADKHKNAYLTWMAFVGGPRESRRLMGDVVLTVDDIHAKKDFRDGCVPSTWSIDLHYPKKQYAEKYPENPFISYAEFDDKIDRNYGYPIPYRCFYSRNVPNLFMAGRCISVTHEALGTVRVMKTCAMMGEVVGRAASVCVKRDCTPREVYENYWSDLDELLKLPGKAHRATTQDPIEIPADALPVAGPLGMPTGLDPAKLQGVILDDADAEKAGKWTHSEGLPGFVGFGYYYASANSDSRMTFKWEAVSAGTYEVRLAYQPHENRGTRVPVTIECASGRTVVRVNMRERPPLENGFISLGKFRLSKGEPVRVVVSSEDAGGAVHADAVQILPAP
jgi:hypothetical protein